MKHDTPPPLSVSLERVIADAPPLGGWRRVEPTGEARVSCTCGLDTGLVPAAEAESAAREHVRTCLPGVPFDVDDQAGPRSSEEATA